MTAQQWPLRRGPNRAQDVYRFAANDDGQWMRARFNEDEARAAQLVTAHHATDVEDARVLLDMLGLLPEGVTAPGARAARWTTGMEGR